MLISLKKFGVEHSVNPEYVTSCAPRRIKNYKPGMPEFTDAVSVWVVGNSGYGTYEITLKGTTCEEVAKFLNLKEQKKQRKAS